MKATIQKNNHYCFDTHTWKQLSMLIFLGFFFFFLVGGLHFVLVLHTSSVWFKS